MKILLLLFLCISIIFSMSFNVCAVEKIKKIAENNVEVVHTKEITDINGIVFEVLAEDEPESFGQDELTRQLEEIDKQILYWTNFDEKAYKQEMLDKATARKTLLLKIQTEMNKK